MVSIIKESEDFIHSKVTNENNIKPNYIKCNEKVSHSLNVVAVFAVNYIATIKGNHYDFEKIEKMIWDKKLEAYEKKHHPVYLKFILKDNSNLADLVLQRMNSKVDRTIIVNTVKIDSKTVTYFYLGAKDIVDPEKSRILIFSIISNSILREIRDNMPEFGTSKDMLQHSYYVPNDLDTVVRHVQLYCLPSLGNHVSEMREKLASPLKRLFSKKIAITKISPRNNGVKSKRHSNKSETSTGSKKNSMNGKLGFKSNSIQSLLLENSDTNHLAVNFNGDYKSNSHTDIHKSISTHSSFNDDKSNDSNNPICSKFEHLLHDERGLRYFKEFLTKERSTENIRFWEAVQNFITIENPELMKIKASQIFYTFVDEKSDTPVNLECDVVEQVRSLLKEPRVDMFTAASNHILYLMKTDSYNRFRKSEYFNLWHTEYKKSTGLKHASSTSSLNQSKKRMGFLPNIFKGKKDKPKKEDSRKSSQTLDSDCSSSSSTATCNIAMHLEEPETHCVNIQPNRKLIQVLKRIDKKFPENDAVAFDQSDNRIVPFSESMANLVGQRIIVEKSVVIRVGFVQVNMDVNLLEYVWFVIRPRHMFGLSHVLDPVAKRVGVELAHCVVIKEEEPNPIGWDTQIHTLNKCSLFLVEQTTFRRAKFYGKSSNTKLDALWKKMIGPESFLSTLAFDDENILDSRHDSLSKYKLEPRKVGYIMAGANPKGDPLDLTITRAFRNSYDDQRGFLTESQLTIPDFLKEFHKQESVGSSSLSSNRFSEIMYGDSDLSFSEIDEFSAPSPTKLDMCSDVE